MAVAFQGEQSQEVLPAVKIVNAGDSQAKEVLLGGEKECGHLLRAGFRKHTIHQAHGVFKQDAGWLPSRVAENLAAGWVWRVMLDTGQCERGGIGPGRVQGLSKQDHRVAVGNSIKLLPGAIKWGSPKVVIPVVTCNPAVGGGLFRVDP